MTDTATDRVSEHVIEIVKKWITRANEVKPGIIPNLWLLWDFAAADVPSHCGSDTRQKCLAFVAGLNATDDQQLVLNWLLEGERSER